MGPRNVRRAPKRGAAESHYRRSEAHDLSLRRSQFSMSIRNAEYAGELRIRFAWI